MPEADVNPWAVLAGLYQHGHRTGGLSRNRPSGSDVQHSERQRATALQPL